MVLCICATTMHVATVSAQQSRYPGADSNNPSDGGFNPFHQPPSSVDINLTPLPTQPGLPAYQQPPSMPQMPTLPQSAAKSSPQNGQIIRGVPSPATSFAKQPQSNNMSGSENDCPDCTAVDRGHLGFFQHGLQQGQGEEQSPPEMQIPGEFQPGHYPRYLGFGEPLTGTSWQNRPWHIDFFSGTMIGDDAIDGVIGQEAGFFVGTRLGWDYDYYWGVESRLGMAWSALFDRRNPNVNLGDGNIIVWDMHLLYYPWGDSRWRPFFLVGTGITQFDSFGPRPALYNATLFEIPFGLGLKYHLNQWLAWRFDVTDNFAVGTGSLDNMHNISFDAGLEYHFGGHRREYWPWNPNPKH